MKFGPLSLDHAQGKILGHNIAGPDGKRLLRKGKPLSAEDIAALSAIGRSSAYVAEIEPGDLDEDTAARRVAEAVQGRGLRLSGPASGRVNFLATVQGVLRVDVPRLTRLNSCDGVTLATLASHTAVRPKQIAATVKIIPFAIPESVIQSAEAVAHFGGLSMLWVDELTPQPVGLILSGSPSLREKLVVDFAPLYQRVEALGSHIQGIDYVPLEDESGEEALARTLAAHKARGARLIILAGETAIMDRHDILPRAIERAGGEVACFGVPVDPGNLLLIAYLGQVPVLGAPGCARSRKINIVDWVLPRLLVGDRLGRDDLFALGHGGLLEDAPERPMPRTAESDLPGLV
jgi:molybdenum cofactor cytidylyltransferase